MTDLAEVVSDLEPLLARAAALIPCPDTEATSGAHTKPGSRPPWNPSAAAATYDAVAAIHETRSTFLFIVTGHSAPTATYHGTARALAAIVSLSHAVPHDHVKRAARDLLHHATMIMQLAAVDEAERPQRISADCRYCGFGMLWVYPREGLVACLRGGVCTDSNGQPPRGWLRLDRFGEPSIEWSDGLVT